jgi:hypothetical protein
VYLMNKTMNKNCYIYPYKNSLLMAVPAVHHQTAFARHVHSIFRNAQQLPDAVAVELGHNLVLELVSFLKQLKQGLAEKVLLPCMLGIMKRNRFIHSDQTGRALLLQEFHRLPLYNLPDALLADRLNFSKWSTIFISPGDSIIEAVRCAIELDIPVYGVDLSDFASTAVGRYRIEDPYCAVGSLTEYGNRIMKYCDTGRDMKIDFNRETLMASGLKYCLTKHRKVLFTCGMAHWKSIVSLLADESIIPFPVYEIPGESEFRRVIIHPTLAAPVMEIIPQITFNYERSRQPVTLQAYKGETIMPERMIRMCLDDVYKEYTSTGKSDSINNFNSGRWSDINNYEQYLFQLAAIRQLKNPDFSAILDSAKVMMSDEFCRLLINKIMDTDTGWITQKDFPDLDLLIHVRNEKQGVEEEIIRKMIRLKSGSTSGTGRNKREDIISSTELPLNQNIESGDINEFWELSLQEMAGTGKLCTGSPWIWPPCEALIYGVAFKAAEISMLNIKRVNDSSAFNGSLEGGIDLKATMRSVIRGEKNIYVSKLASVVDESIMDGTNPDPFVLIFPESSDMTAADWSFFTAGSELESTVKDPDLLAKIKREKGSVFVSSVILEEKIAPPAHLKPLIWEMSKTIGTAMFGNPCINAKQSAIWLESAGYKCCPIISESGMPSLIRYYADCYNLEFNFEDWKETLIRMAIPFAKKIVTILAPDSFKLSELVKTEASERRVSLNLVSTANFAESQLEEARHRFSIYTLDRSGIDFPPETETILGQTKETYFEMLPYAMQKQVGYSDSFNR